MSARHKVDDADAAHGDATTWISSTSLATVGLAATTTQPQQSELVALQSDGVMNSGDTLARYSEAVQECDIMVEEFHSGTVRMGMPSQAPHIGFSPPTDVLETIPYGVKVAPVPASLGPRSSTRRSLALPPDPCRFPRRFISANLGEPALNVTDMGGTGMTPYDVHELSLRCHDMSFNLDCGTNGDIFSWQMRDETLIYKNPLLSSFICCSSLHFTFHHQQQQNNKNN
ncbi:hypothetical protein SODALDRAFT_377032 [Sodiomyces alkalinus F11]|uniref:Uncharacterized protein n=1 Tax=Sodiomyces alkalinus (strain CBS 110278 / VKM F-3762 / F11) TaxID=1314773 RepID=A0A3N2Q3N0_SODAK|nr:hypothetical protein SODALDRAFT_377032 [Sodiomyces alkalinus F11]ROT41352.1 hypothetical protein SODALDRAFT_377032 [Sodiomyces alkalinus F11]